MLEVNSRI